MDQYKRIIDTLKGERDSLKEKIKTINEEDKNNNDLGELGQDVLAALIDKVDGVLSDMEKTDDRCMSLGENLD